MSRRLEMIGSVIRDVVSDAIQRRLSDPRILTFTSVTRVEISGDLQHANVHVSVMGTEQEQRACLRGLMHARGHVQSMVAKRVRARQCPRIEFLLDSSIKKASETLRVIDEAMVELARTDSEGEAHEDEASPEGGRPEGPSSDFGDHP